MSAATLSADSDLIRNYLLRRLAEPERARFEEAYFSDDALLDRVELEEDRLVADYVLGRLTESDRRRFETSLLGTPYYQERVQTTSRLQQRLARHRASRPDRPNAPRAVGSEPARLFPGRTGLVVAFSLLVVLLAAAVLSALRLKSDVEALKSRLETPRPTVPASTAGAGVVPAARAVVFSIENAAGPALRRAARANAGEAILLVFSRRLLPVGATAWSVHLSERNGARIWESGRQPLDRDAGHDLALRLPPGVPAAGWSSLVLRCETEKGAVDAYATVLAVEESAR